MKSTRFFAARLPSRALAAVLGSALALAHSAGAANLYFDVNGADSGYGVNEGGNYTWEDPNWASAAGGGNATAGWVQGSFPRFPGGVNYTVTVTSSEQFAGLLLNTDSAGASTITINATGTGKLDLLANAGLTAGLPAQGFFGQNATAAIYAPIVGAGAIQIPVGGGNIQLFGNNTYSGGTALSSSATLTSFNNNSSFGTGPINLNSSAGSFASLLSMGGSAGNPLTITLPNTFTNFSGGYVNFGSAAYTPVVCAGPWYLQAFNSQIRNNGDTTAPLTLEGAINGTGSLTFSGNNGGTIILRGASTYSGQTILAGVNLAVSVDSLNRVVGGSPTSNLGHPTTVAAGTIHIGTAASASRLIYTGPGETSDRVINLAGATGGAVLQADGAGALLLTAANTATGSGAKTLTLQGANSAGNSIGAIPDSAGGPTAVTKAQTGVWILTGINTYSGGTTVAGGTLEISGSVAGNITNTGGTLRLDHPAAMAASSTLAVNSGNTVHLNYSGTNVLNSLIIDGIPQISGVWGAPGSTAPNKSAIFAGTTGFINILGKPVILQQPVSGAVFPNGDFSFHIVVDGDLSTLTYQWKLNGHDLPGANADTLFIYPARSADAGTYTCWVTNAFGWAGSAGAALNIVSTNTYTETIRGDFPTAYWRLGETNGSLAYDPTGGFVGLYRNVLLDQPGYSLVDSDPAIGLPGAAVGRGYVSITNNQPFLFPYGSSFTLEAWAYFTNLTGVQSLFSTFALSGGNGWRFGINGNNALRFTTGSVADIDQPISPALIAGAWYHLVCLSDGFQYHFYVNGVEQGAGKNMSNPNGISQPLTLGCNPLAYTNNNTGDPLAEQIKGRLDEMAVYSYALSGEQVSNHYSARYAGAPAPVPATPVVTPATNYAGLATTLQENAAGQNLAYQWFKAPSALIPGATKSTLTLSPLQTGDAGDYYVRVSGLGGISSNSPTAHVAVLPIPSSADQINLTNLLVLHLPFDSDYNDISGRNNHGANIGATALINDGAIGKALHYYTDTGAASTNYVTLGIPADLQFGTSSDFTVAYWVRQPAGSSFTNLPFIANEPVGATAGWMFAPYQQDDSTFGGWFEAIGSMTSPSAFTSFPDANLINDGTWHHLAHSATRTANIITYLDGAQVDSQAIGFLGSLSTTTPVNIGQDSTGAYPVTASADIDDLGIWRRALTPLEISGMYLAGASNKVSFAPPVLVREALQITQVAPGQWQLSWSGGGVLQASGNVTGSFTNVIGATSPYPLPNLSAGQLFFRLEY